MLSVVFDWIEKWRILGHALEDLESSGIQAFRNRHIVRKLCKGENRDKIKDITSLKMNLKVVVFLGGGGGGGFSCATYYLSEEFKELGFFFFFFVEQILAETTI